MILLTIGLFSGCLFVYLWYIHRCYGYFQRLGIDGPRPMYFFGNVWSLVRNQRMSISIRNWTNEFGRVYGYFEGHTPILVISDPNILDEIFVKNFSRFHSRRQFPLEDRSTRKGIHLFSATDDQWRRQRKLLNPTFSPLKIKRMLPLIDACIDNLLSKLDEYGNQQFDIVPIYKSLTMDFIWRCCFRLETDMQHNPHNPYLIRSRQVFARESNIYLSTVLAIFLPEFQACWLRIHQWLNSIKAILRRTFPFGEKFIADDPNEWLKENVDEFLHIALQQNPEEINLLQMMLEATEDSALTLNDVKQNIYLFMIAGYETASTALAYVTYILATHPVEQKKLQDTIDFYLSQNTHLDEDQINQMEYLDWFVRETLRMYPITPITINRQCAEDIFIPGLGYIASGTRIAVDMYSLHYDQDLWGPVDTKQFYPERFATKRHSLAWMAFGAGPRNCIGMRFALIEIKMTIIRLIQKYTIFPSMSEKQELELVELVTIGPKEFIIRLEQRTHHFHTV